MMEGDEVVMMVTEMLKDMEEVTMGFSPIMVEDVDVVSKEDMADDINVVDVAMLQHHVMLMDKSFLQIIGTVQMNGENSANRME